MYHLSLRSDAHEPAHSGLTLFKFGNKTLEILNSAELMIPAPTVAHEHSKRNVFDLSLALKCAILMSFGLFSPGRVPLRISELDL